MMYYTPDRPELEKLGLKGLAPPLETDLRDGIAEILDASYYKDLFIGPEGDQHSVAMLSWDASAYPRIELDLEDVDVDRIAALNDAEKRVVACFVAAADTFTSDWSSTNYKVRVELEFESKEPDALVLSTLLKALDNASIPWELKVQ